MAEQEKNHIPAADPHVRFWSSSVGSERLRAALSTAAQKGFTPRHETALSKVDKLAAKNESQINLRDFDPPENVDAIKERLARSTFLPVKSISFQMLLKKAQTTTDRSYWRSHEGKQLLEDVNVLTYQKIREAYGSGDGESFFNDRMDEANETIANMVNTKLTNKKGTLGLLNETILMSSPAKLVQSVMSPNTDRRLQYELLRTLTVAELAAGIKQRAGSMKGKVDDFQALLDETVFEHGNKVGEGEAVEVFTFHDNETGTPLWISYVHQPLYPEEVRAFSETAFLKKSTMQSRDAGGDIGLVLTHPRTKDKKETLAKMIREAKNREKILGDHVVEPSGIVDLGGIRNVVMSERNNSGAKIDGLIERHRELAKLHFEIADAAIEIKDEKAGYTGQSDDHSFKRLLIDLSGGHFMEEIFVSLPSHLKNENEYGKPDPQTGIYTGPAHPVYAETRWEKVAETWFPEEIYGRINWNELLRDATQAAVEKIRDENRVAPESLPEEYILTPETPNA